MAYTPTSRLLYGQWIAQIWRLDANNYPKGTLAAPDSPVAGTVYSPYVIPAPISYQAADDTFAEVSSFANTQLRARVQVALTDFANDTFTLSELDDTFDSLVMGYTNDVTTATSMRIRARNSGRRTPRRFGLALTRASATKDNVISYETIIKMNVQFRRAAGSNTSQTFGQNPDPLAYTVIKARNSRMPWGKAFSSSSNLVVDGNADDEISIQGPAPIMAVTYVDDGAATTFALPYAPDYTEHAGAYNIIYKNGTSASVTSISGSTVTITAGSSGDIWTFFGPSTALLTA